MTRLPAFKVDAFTTRPFTGNPAGVVLGAEGLTEAQMQAIAREMNVSETAFLLPPTTPAAAHRLRYFTPTAEVPLCGHATVATFHLLVERGRLKAPAVFTLETRAGLLPVEIRSPGPQVFLASEPVRFEPSPLPPAEVAALVGCDAGDLLVEPRPLLVNRMLVFPVRGLKTLGGMRPDFRGMAERCRALEIDGLLPVSFEAHAPRALTHVRYFVPSAGIDEDPATGVAHLRLGAWLAHTGRLDLSKGPSRFGGEQGHFVGRPAELQVEVAGTAEAPSVRVGGSAVTVLEGSIRVP